MKRYFLTILASSILLFGCATREAFEAKLRLWEGRNINDLIAKAGPPASTFHMPNGNIIYTYSETSVGVTPVYRAPTQTTVNMIGNTAYATTTGGQVYGGQPYQNSCTVNFIVDQTQTIIAWQFAGNACRARPD